MANITFNWDIFINDKLFFLNMKNIVEGVE
jgi:hypothetical protein